MLIISKDDLKEITQFPYVLELGILLIFTYTSKGFHHQRSVGETKTVFFPIPKPENELLKCWIILVKTFYRSQDVPDHYKLFILESVI